MATSVTRQTDPDRFEITVDGEVVGFAEFLDRDDQRIFFHTEIEEAFGGRGLGGIVVGEALAATVAAGRRIVPVCPFVKAHVDRHDTYAEAVDPVTPEVLDAVSSR